MCGRGPKTTHKPMCGRGPKTTHKPKAHTNQGRSLDGLEVSAYGRSVAGGEGRPRSGARSKQMKTLCIAAWVVVGVTGCSGADYLSAEPIDTAAQAQTCDLSGTWAAQFEIPVTWPATFIVQGGTGTITVRTRVQTVNT